MHCTFDSVLEDDLVTVVEQNDGAGHFCIRIGALQTPVTIELGRHMDSDRTKFTVSHAIKTPSLAGPYRTSLPFSDTPVSALRKAVSGLTMHYRQAIHDGHEPRENWLVEY